MFEVLSGVPLGLDLSHGAMASLRYGVVLPGAGACKSKTNPRLPAPTLRCCLQPTSFPSVRSAILPPGGHPAEQGCLERAQANESGSNLARRSFLLFAVSAAALSPVGTASADVRIALTGIEAIPVACPEGQTTVTGRTSFGATCYRVTGNALNPLKQPVYNVDIFGRVYDAQGEPALDAAESLRIDTIPEVPPGKSRFSFQLTVSESQAKLGPLELKNFKGTGYLGRVNYRQGSGRLDDIDFSELDDDGDFVP